MDRTSEYTDWGILTVGLGPGRAYSRTVGMGFGAETMAPGSWAQDSGPKAASPMSLDYRERTTEH